MRCRMWVTVLVAVALPVCADAADLSGHVLDPSGASLAGAAVTLRPVAGPASGTTPIITDAAGGYRLSLDPGAYVVSVELDGFLGVERVVTMATQPITLDFTLTLDVVHQEISVVGTPPPVMGEPGTGSPATIPREVIQNAAMLPNSTYDDALTLLPNVVRAPDGSISIAGARAPQGVLAVNGLTQIDPVSGAPGVLLPINAVDSMQVLGRGTDSEFGRATGSVTSIETVSGTDKVTARLDSFLPRLHFVEGDLRGIEAFEPGLGVSGPLVKGHAWLAESVDYRFVRERFDTLSGIEDSKFTTLLSWTELDVKPSASHRVETWVAFDPQRTDHAFISAFTPLAAVPEATHGGARSGVVDRAVVGGRTTIESGAQVARLPGDLTPAGTLSYVMGHDGYGGNYFNAQHRQALRSQWSEVIARAQGSHLFKAGGELVYQSFSGTNVSAPVTMTRSDGSAARVVEFGPGGPQSASSVEAGAFAQDHWDITPAFTLDTGVRLDRSSAVGGARVSPRAAWTWALNPSHTTVSGSAGLYVDKLLLSQTGFPDLQSRLVTEYDTVGRVTSRGLYRNVTNGFELPSATAWSAQVDQQFAPGWQARLVYQERRGRHEAVVTPVDAAGQIVLSSAGASHARSIEATAGFAPAGQSIWVSYVRSSAVGNLNDVASIEGAAKEPFVQADAVGPVAADAPNRLLMWGVFKLPGRVTFAPFLEVHSGFPYLAIDDSWRYVGARNSYRFPVYRSLDIYVNKVVHIPWARPQARVGFKGYNITNAQDPRDVQRDIERPDFGQTYTPTTRFFCGVFEILWGHG